MKVVALLSSIAPLFRVGAQRERSQVVPTAGVVGGVVQPSYSPLGAPAVAGVVLGAEFGTGILRLRPAVRAIGSLPEADDAAICLFPKQTSTGLSCFQPTYARWYFGVSSDVLFEPSWLGLADAITGFGWTALRGGTTRPSTERLPEGRSFWRLGAGVRLGRSRRAPRLEISKLQFLRHAGTAHHLTSIELWFR